MTALAIENPSTEGMDVPSLVTRLRSLSIRSLRRMYLAERGGFVFCVRRDGATCRAEGVSRRYTAIVLIGLAAQPQDVAARVLVEGDVHALCGRLLDDVERMDNVGDVALTLWAAAVLEHKRATRALDRLRRLAPGRGPYPTVEIAWAVSALCANREHVGDDDLAQRVVGRLLSTFHATSGFFSHWPDDAVQSVLRSHVCCFADLVYPVQALSYYYSVTGDESAIEAARCCAESMCRRQGSAGQWWWHFDVRTGCVIERYPVYAVHQDAMGPMALLALKDACGAVCDDAVERGLGWLLASEELGGGTLIDEQADMIWRKVARCEPGKLSRGLQALASRAHPRLRVPGLASVFRPQRVDYECRPYHLGWLLHAWPEQRLEQWQASGTS